MMMNAQNASRFWGYNDRIIWKRIKFLDYSFHRWNVCGAYAIRPYRVTGKRIAFLRSHVGAYCIRPTERHSKNSECAKRVNFSGYNDRIIWKRVTFWIFIFDKWWKRGSFFGYIDLGIWKSGALPPCPYLLFLSWYKKGRQKKIKASAEAGEVDRVHDWSWKRITFWGHNDRINWKRTFYGLHRWCKSQKVVFEVCTAGASISKVAFGRYSMLSKTFYRDKGPHSFVLHIE